MVILRNIKEKTTMANDSNRFKKISSVEITNTSEDVILIDE